MFIKMKPIFKKGLLLGTVSVASISFFNLYQESNSFEAIKTKLLNKKDEELYVL